MVVHEKFSARRASKESWRKISLGRPFLPVSLFSGRQTLSSSPSMWQFSCCNALSSLVTIAFTADATLANRVPSWITYSVKISCISRNLVIMDSSAACDCSRHSLDGGVCSVWAHISVTVWYASAASSNSLVTVDESGSSADTETINRGPN